MCVQMLLLIVWLCGTQVYLLHALSNDIRLERMHGLNKRQLVDRCAGTGPKSPSDNQTTTYISGKLRGQAITIVNH